MLLPAAERRRTPEKRRPIGRERQLLKRPAGVLRKLGPYQVRGAVRWDDGGKVLAAEDSSLGREVWIELRPKSAPAARIAARTFAPFSTALARRRRARRRTLGRLRRAFRLPARRPCRF